MSKSRANFMRTDSIMDCHPAHLRELVDFVQLLTRRYLCDTGIRRSYLTDLDSFIYASVCTQSVSRIARSLAVKGISDRGEINAKKIFCFHYVIELERIASSFKKHTEQQRSENG